MVGRRNFLLVVCRFSGALTVSFREGKYKASLVVTGSLAFSEWSFTSNKNWVNCSFSNAQRAVLTHRKANLSNIYEVWHIGIVKSSVNVPMARCLWKKTHVIPLGSCSLQCLVGFQGCYCNIEPKAIRDFLGV